MFKQLQIWGRDNPVTLATIAFFFGLVPVGGMASIGGYNLGFYNGSEVANETWRSSFSQKLASGINEQVASKCGQAVSEVNGSCQKQIGALERNIASRDKSISDKDKQIASYQRKIDVVDMAGRTVDGCQSILKGLLAARQKGDQSFERNLKDSFYSLLGDIHRLNQLYVEWSSLFDGRATSLIERYGNGQSIPTDEIIRYLEGFTSDFNLRKKVIESEIEEANKIKSKKY